LTPALLSGALGAFAQPSPDIELDPAIECWPHSSFPTLSAFVDPAEEVVRSRLYFRCSLYADYYFVDLEAENGVLTAIAPQAEESCPRVHYYVEAVTRDFSSVRTPERMADVTSDAECRRRNPAAAFFPGEDPEILLGSTVAGPSLAPGFKSLGVAGFLSAAGTVAAAGAAQGGSSALVLAAVAGGGAAAVGVGVLATSGDPDPEAPPPATASAPPPPATPAPPVTPTPPPGPGPAPPELKACFVIEPSNGVVKVNEPVKIDGRCSEGGAGLLFTYDLGDGRVKKGQAFVTAFWPRPGLYTLTLTVERPSAGFAPGDTDTFSRQITVEEEAAPLEPDFVVRNLNVDLCLAEFDGSPSRGDIDAYRWVLDVNNDFGEGVVRTQGRIVRHEWSFKSRCFNLRGSMIARLTVVGENGETASVEKRVNVLGLGLSSKTSAVRTSFTSQLLEGNGLRAHVVVPGGRTEPVAPGVAVRHSYEGERGRQIVDGVVSGSADGPARWRFDFSASPHFVPGSLRLVSGREVSRGPREIVVRLSGQSGERVRLEYELR